MAEDHFKAPEFSTQKQEAEWWDDHRDAVSAAIADAGNQGKLKILTKERLQERLTSRRITIRLSEGGILLAQKQAERKDLPHAGAFAAAEAAVSDERKNNP